MFRSGCFKSPWSGMFPRGVFSCDKRKKRRRDWPSCRPTLGSRCSQELGARHTYRNVWVFMVCSTTNGYAAQNTRVVGTEALGPLGLVVMRCQPLIRLRQIEPLRSQLRRLGLLSLVARPLGLRAISLFQSHRAYRSSAAPTKAAPIQSDRVGCVRRTPTVPPLGSRAWARTAYCL